MPLDQAGKQGELEFIEDIVEPRMGRAEEHGVCRVAGAFRYEDDLNLHVVSVTRLECRAGVVVVHEPFGVAELRWTPVFM